MLMLYFSGTGNSKYIADLFCERMNEQACVKGTILLTHILSRSIEEELDFASMIASEDTIAFCYPVYGSRIPRIVREFAMRHKDQLEGKDLIIFCTQMAFSGDGSRAFTDIFPKGFFQVVYAEHFIMPNNICNFFILPLEKEKTVRKKLLRAEKRMSAVCEELQNGAMRRRGFNPVSRALGLVQGVFMPGIERKALSRVWISEGCTACGQCVSTCPMSNLEYEDGKVAAKGNCTICCRCINTCPQKALRILFREKVKKQYKGVEHVIPGAAKRQPGI